MFSLLITVCVMNGAICNEYVPETDLSIKQCADHAVVYAKQDQIDDVVCQLQPKKGSVK